MSNPHPPAAIAATEVPAKRGASAYPAPYAARVAEREKRALGNVFGLRNFGVNLTRLPPGAMSALRHAHARQDEFIYVLSGTPVLVSDAGETPLVPGMCAGFRAGSGDAHHLLNRGGEDAVFIEIGDRSAGDSVAYPDDDLSAVSGDDGRWRFLHKDGSPY